MEELTGGIKNALEKGESMEKVKQSFLNAGYTSREVNAAIAALNTQITRTSVPPTQDLTTNKLPTPTPSKSKRKFPWLIIIIILAILILIGVAILGFFFDDLMQTLFK